MKWKTPFYKDSTERIVMRFAFLPIGFSNGAFVEWRWLCFVRIKQRFLYDQLGGYWISTGFDR